jgi:isopentenyldiphosphate isomerase
MSIQEHVILVNDQGMVIGTQEKYAAHTLHTPLHLAFSSWLFNAKGECLITRRALSKKPGPASGPTPSAATAVGRRDRTGDNPPLPL